jgi:PAS domain S-box-containing protein
MFPKVWSTTQRRASLSIEGIGNILESLAFPAMLITNDEQILAVNQYASEISGYSAEEIIGLNLRAIFPNLIGRGDSVATICSLPDHSVSTTLVNRNYQRVPITLRLHELSGQETHYLMTFDPIAKKQRIQSERQKRHRLLSNIEGLFQALDAQDPLQEILKIGSNLIISNVISIYLCDTDSPTFRKAKSWGEAEFLPREIPPTDLKHLLKPGIWTNRQRSVITLLHQAVRATDHLFLATAPIGSPGAWTGILVASGVEEPDAELTIPVLQILAEAVSLHLQQNIRIVNIEQELTTAAKQLTIRETIRETIQEGVILISPSLKILELNAAAEYILGYASREISGHTAENILVGTDRLLPAIKLALQGVPTPNLGQTVLHRRDGSSFPVLLNTTPAMQGDEVLGALVILSDVSEHEQTKTRTQQLEQRALLGEVTAVFAHEVRNPINNISTGLQLMAINTPEEDVQQNELIQRLQQDCTRLTDLMESILTFSRTGNYKFEPLDIQSVIDRLLTRWRPRLARLTIHHHIQVAPGTPPILGDQRALEQVFTNLISNAVQAMGERGGTLAFRVAPYYAPSKKVFTQIDISDTGPGIPDEIRERIFDPFFTTNPNGTGLGLAITKQIVTAHKGSIKPTSFPGGTVFHIQIPALDGSEDLII